MTRQPTNHGAHKLFLSFVVLYLIFLSLSAVSGTGLFRALSYPLAFVMFVTIAIQAMASKSSDRTSIFFIPLAIYYYGLVGSSLFNYDTLDYPVLLKFLLAPAFLAFAYKIETSAPARVDASKYIIFLLCMLLVLPIAVLAVQLIKGYAVLARGADFSVFVNRNNAALYAVAVLALISVYLNRPINKPIIHLGAGASFATIGVLVAVIASLITLVTSRKNALRSIVFILLATVIATLMAQQEIGVFARFKPVVGTLDLLFFSDKDFRALSYGQLVALLNTTDLSLAFRIKHWLDIYDIYTQGSHFNWFFGYGVGSSEILTTDRIIPHNDYLRLIFETGVVTFIGFVYLIYRILRILGRSWYTVPFFAISIYMLSENLMDNFIAMSIFYYSAGVLARRNLVLEVSRH